MKMCSNFYLGDNEIQFTYKTKANVIISWLQSPSAVILEMGKSIIIYSHNEYMFRYVY